MADKIIRKVRTPVEKPAVVPPTVEEKLETSSVDASPDVTNTEIGELPKLNERFERIVTVVVDIDPESTWLEIREWIAKKPENALHLQSIIYEHAAIAEKAKRLYLVAKAERVDYEHKFKDRMQILRDDALGFWEGEKQNKKLTKQVTEQMIEDRIIAEHPVAYNELTTRLNNIKSVVEMFEELCNIVTARGVDLRKILDMESRRPGSNLGWMSGPQGKKG